GGAAVRVGWLGRIEDDVGALCQAFEHTVGHRVVHFQAHALLAEVVTSEAQALFRVVLRRGEGAAAARVGAAAALQLDDFGAERREQQSRELSALVAAFHDDASLSAQAPSCFPLPTTNSPP